MIHCIEIVVSVFLLLFIRLDTLEEIWAYFFLSVLIAKSYHISMYFLILSLCVLVVYVILFVANEKGSNNV